MQAGGAEMEGLTVQQQETLRIFQEVTGGARDERAAAQLLRNCSWNVEQAAQLFWASADEETGNVPLAAAAASASAAAPPPAASSSGGAFFSNLGQPLLEAVPGGAPGGGGAAPPAAAGAGRPSIMGWLTQGLRRLSDSVLGLVRAFIFGANRAGGGAAAFLGGAALRQSLTAAYGSQLELPNFFEGSFTQAIQAAQRDLKLVVVYLHSASAQHSQGVCTGVLGNEFVRSMLNENYIVWGGDMARQEAQAVARMVHAREFPSFCVILPASVDDLRVIGAASGDIQVDGAVALLTASMEDMETHRAELVARTEQQVEDRMLREQQDREYQEALEMDRKRAEEQRLQEQQEREAKRLEEEKRLAEQQLAEQQEAERLAFQDDRRRRGSELPAPTSEATARISLRLPAGQRIERKFPPGATLAEVYAWAEVAAYVPENDGKGLEIPERFLLKTSFPSRDLVEKDQTIEALQLAGSNILLAEIEDD